MEERTREKKDTGSSRAVNSDNLPGLDCGICLRPVQGSTELVWYQTQFGTRKAA